VLVVWKLDRLGRSIKHVIETVESLRQRGVGFRSLTEGFDTTTPAGEMIFHVIGAIAHMERRLIKERVTAGLKAAKARGRRNGRKAKLTGTQIAHARRLIGDGDSVRSVAATLRVGKRTLYRALAADSVGLVFGTSKPLETRAAKSVPVIKCFRDKSRSAVNSLSAEVREASVDGWV
jgi:DNA invertase Pin-like site-specific DNA recombinase